ncbi:unnamed protein product [Prunus brigantina]
MLWIMWMHVITLRHISRHMKTSYYHHMCLLHTPNNLEGQERLEGRKQVNATTRAILLFVVSSQQTTQTSEAGPSTKTRRAKPARSVQKGKWKRKAINAAGSSNAPPTDSAAPSSTPTSGSTSLATRSAPPASIGNSYLLRKRPMVVGASNLSKE